MSKPIHIFFPFFSEEVCQDLDIRYDLYDYIQNNYIGEVYEEGTGEDGMHIFLETKLEKILLESKLSTFFNSKKVPKYTIEFNVK